MDIGVDNRGPKREDQQEVVSSARQPVKTSPRPRADRVPDGQVRVRAVRSAAAGAGAIPASSDGEAGPGIVVEYGNRRKWRAPRDAVSSDAAPATAAAVTEGAGAQQNSEEAASADKRERSGLFTQRPVLSHSSAAVAALGQASGRPRVRHSKGDALMLQRSPSPRQALDRHRAVSDPRKKWLPPQDTMRP